jgi:hypothetical protein
MTVEDYAPFGIGIEPAFDGPVEDLDHGPGRNAGLLFDLLIRGAEYLEG